MTMFGVSRSWANHACLKSMQYDRVWLVHLQEYYDDEDILFTTSAAKFAETYIGARKEPSTPNRTCARVPNESLCKRHEYSASVLSITTTP